MARPEGSRLAIALFLGLLCVVLLPAVSASLYQFYDGVSDPPPDYPTGGQATTIFRNQWGAQSFVASANYTLARADLWAMANGASGGNATLVLTTDRSGSPDLFASPLATATASAPNAYGWISFNVAPNALLAKGTVYWLVLENNGNSGSQGWSWWNTLDNASVPGGAGEISSSSGTAWSAAGGSFEIRTFGYIDAAVGVGASVDHGATPAGGSVTATVWFNNTGTAPAGTIWINATLPAGLAYVSDNAAASNGVRTGDTRWTFSGVSPGPHSFLLVLSIGTDVSNHSFLVFRVDLAYTDFRGESMPASTTTVTVLVSGAASAGPGWWDPLAASLLAALVAWVLVVAVWPRGKIEEVFLVNNAGTLVAHLSQTDETRMDHDIFVGMLTAVQDFIRESFSRARGEDLRHLDFGRQKIMIRRGSQSYLAVVVRGRVPPTLNRRIARTLAKVEASYADVLAHWGGEMERVKGSKDILVAGLLG